MDLNGLILVLTLLSRHRRTIRYVEFLCEVIDYDCFCLFFRHMFHPRSFWGSLSTFSPRFDRPKKKGTDEVRRDQLTPYFLFKCVSCVTASEKKRPFSETLTLLTFQGEVSLYRSSSQQNQPMESMEVCPKHPCGFRCFSRHPWLLGSTFGGDLGTLGPWGPRWRQMRAAFVAGLLRGLPC